jgi:hypothetical protein
VEGSGGGVDLCIFLYFSEMFAVRRRRRTAKKEI